MAWFWIPKSSNEDEDEDEEDGGMLLLLYESRADAGDSPVVLITCPTSSNGVEASSVPTMVGCTLMVVGHDGK